VAGRQEEAEQAGIVEIAVEQLDAPPAAPVALFPVLAAGRIEIRGDEGVIGMGIVIIARLAEEAEQVSMGGKVANFMRFSATWAALRSTASTLAGERVR
jgi:hypothetical protein